MYNWYNDNEGREIFLVQIINFLILNSVFNCFLRAALFLKKVTSVFVKLFGLKYRIC